VSCPRLRLDLWCSDEGPPPGLVQVKPAASDEDSDALRRRFADAAAGGFGGAVVVEARTGGGDGAEIAGKVVGVVSGEMDGWSAVDGVGRLVGALSASSTMGASEL
jgi:hypothetical protein